LTLPALPLLNGALDRKRQLDAEAFHVALDLVLKEDELK